MASDSAFGVDQVGMDYLIEGLVLNNARACVTDLLLELQDGRTHPLKVLVSRKGRIQEMVRLPVGVRTLRLSQGDGELFAVVRLAARRLGAAEHKLRQFWRASQALLRQPAENRTRTGLTLKAVLFDLDHAYDIACRLRANVRTGQYCDWYHEFYGLAADDRPLMAAMAANWSHPPVFHIVLLRKGDSMQADIDTTSASLQAQIYPHFQVKVEEGAFAAAPTPSGEQTQGIWQVTVRAGVRLAEQALFCLAEAIVKTPGAALVYADHDQLDPDGRLHSPVFKPDWSPEMLRATNYIGEAFACNAQYTARLAGLAASSRHALLLELGALDLPVLHVAAPLWHVPDSAPATGTSEIVRAHLQRLGVVADVVDAGAGRCRVRYTLPSARPLVSIVIPTRDGLHHLRRCIDSLIGRTAYAFYEILVIDNQSMEPQTLAYLGQIRQLPNVRVLPFDRAFNYSSINNMAVGHAQGELVCLLNNDTEVISPDWLDEMVGQISRSDIGVVGAKLLYGDGRVQHAGDTVGPGGCANHLHVGIGRDDPGYAGRALVAQDLSAVTAACLLTRKSLYQALGGLEEKRLPVAFNDVDYCLRVREAGLRVVWTPHALLYHHESATRGKDETPAQLRRAKSEIRYMRKRWRREMLHDPFYNPNLNYLQADFSLSSTPSVCCPWRGAHVASVHRRTG
ncbi:glycosyltransferase family 2 protein [Bordetella ansorpii]|nr:glycosyltransferase family 2 protein [Bordetella ansorpii]